MTSEFLLPIIKNALAEDIGKGDITSEILIPEDQQALMGFVARQKMIICGIDVPEMVYRELDSDVQVKKMVEEGAHVDPGTVIATVSGPARDILTGERVALNILQRMCGVATFTNRYVEAIKGTKAKILDTRKTMPGLRMLDKYAVRIGGGYNHRMRLDDMVLVKDNHLASAGSDVATVIRHIRATLGSRDIPVVVECDTLAQVKEALPAKPDRIMLDNMPLEKLKEAVALVANQIPLEATGGVTLDNIRAIAETGVDFISIGSLTHSVPAVDIGLDAL